MDAPAPSAVAPPTEVVLAWPLYLLLVGEALALGYLYGTRQVSASSPLGHAIGWIGTASMLAMHVYSIRRRVRALGRWGKLRHWLQLHIFLGLQGAMLVTFHSLHLRTLGNLASLTLAMTLIVVCSGLFGRYLFSLIPKNLNGERLTARDVEAELAAIKREVSGAKASSEPAVQAALDEIDAAVRLDERAPLLALIGEDRRARRALGHLDATLRSTVGGGATAELEQLGKLLARRGLLARRLAMLSVAERLFRNWTILHKPLTYLLAGSVALHIVAHYIYAAQYGG